MSDDFIKKLKEQQFSIQHMVYDFPIDRDVKLNIFPSTFSKLFSVNSRILLPVFQRRYCWNSNTNQLQNWWKDLNKPLTNKHQVGKIILFETNDGLLVVDGQQRCSTSLVILSSIRDAIGKLDQSDSHVQKLSKELNSIFYIDEQKASLFKDSLNEGKQLDFVRFSPTFLDRKTYYQIVLNQPSDQQKEDNFILKSKSFFDEKFSNLSIQRILSVYSQLMNDFAFVHVGLPESEISKGFHIYQWFFEKSLYTEKIFEIKSPGIKHSVQELVKNFMLSFFIHESYQRQNEIYQDYWVAIEKRYSHSDFQKFVKETTKSEKEEPYDLYRDFVEYVEKLLISEKDFPFFILNYLTILRDK
jgi:uncharacterized protein with ParB-like and HNH nuclease domain